jgi:hypothetical protein
VLNICPVYWAVLAVFGFEVGKSANKSQKNLPLKNFSQYLVLQKAEFSAEKQLEKF